MRRVIAAAFSAVLTVACGVGSVSAEVARYNDATSDLDAAVGAYLEMSKRPAPSSASDWKEFLATGEQLTLELRESFDHWSEAVDALVAADAVPAGESPGLLRRLQRTLGAWVTAMEDQLLLTRSCYPAQGGPPDEACFFTAIGPHLEEWEATGARVTTLMQEVYGE